MSSRKVKTIKRTLQYTATWLANVLTVTTATTHYLVNGNIVSLMFAGSPQTVDNVTITNTGSNTFTIPLTDSGIAATGISGQVIVPYFSTSMTGDQDVFSIAKVMDSPSVIQFTAHGTSGAVMVLSVSNDGEGWVPISTITLASSNLATDFVSIAPQWVKAKISITSIGAATTVVVSVTV